MSELFKHNANLNIRVRIKDEGIAKYVKEHNEIMPFHLHTSFNEFKKQADKDGYHIVQFHWLLDNFGNCGIRLAKYIDLDILFESKNLEPYELQSVS